MIERNIRLIGTIARSICEKERKTSEARYMKARKMASARGFLLFTRFLEL